MNLKDINLQPGPNPGGSVRLFLIPWQSIESIPTPQSGIITGNIVLKNGARWFKFEFSPGKCRLQNPSAGSDGSYYFDTIVDVAIPGSDQANLTVFQQMLNGLFLALIDQANGPVKLCGTLVSPLLCKLSHDHGQDTGDFNGTTFQFRSKGFLPAQYTGIIQDYSLLWRAKEDTAYCIQN